MGEIIGKCITILKEAPEWKGRIAVTYVDGITIMDIEDGIPLKTLSSGWGLEGILISIGTVAPGNTKKKKLSTVSSL